MAFRQGMSSGEFYFEHSTNTVSIKPNQPYSSFAIWLFRVLPGWIQWNRFWIYYYVDELYLEYVKNPKAETLRARSEKEARTYMLRKTPEKYLKDVMPDYPVGKSVV